MSLHGQLAALSFGAAARCADCHSAHDILPSTNPNSSLSSANRLQTCQQCHPRATVKFASFDPHADHHDAENYPNLHLVYRFMELLLASVFTFFGVHTVLWLIRSTVHALRHGRVPGVAPKQKAIQRFSPIHRWLHAAVIVSFLGLALTGLPLKFSGRQWAQDLAAALGGFQNTAFWHHLCAIITFGYFTVHLVWVSQQISASRREGRSWRQIFFGPDSMVPAWRDFRDIGRMFRWFVGLGPKPVFERWTYWEKFDYWAVFWGVGIIGASGLLLWFPEFFTLVLPGQVLNVAKVIHSEEALLATGFIFTIHFFNTHLRADKFPMDMSMLAGVVSEEEMAEERPEYLQRLRQSGELDSLRMEAPSPRKFLMLRAAGTIAVAIGIGLLVAIVASVFF
jgi:cytochrome b subunit of formate dehydrogenase